MTEKAGNSFVQSMNDIVDQACTNGTRVILFISPIHVRQLEAIEQSGKWNDFVAWKKSMMELANSKTACDIELWDFARHNRVTEEPVPEVGPMKYYWESSHYRKVVGDAILNACVSRDGDPNALRSKFGDDFGAGFYEKLTPVNFLESIRRENAARDAWQKANPAIVADVASLRRSANSSGE